jgi:hypothetical protein
MVVFVLQYVELFMIKSVLVLVILIVRLSDMDFLAVVACSEKINLSKSFFNCLYCFPFHLKCLSLKIFEGDRVKAMKCSVL